MQSIDERCARGAYRNLARDRADPASRADRRWDRGRRSRSSWRGAQERGVVQSRGGRQLQRDRRNVHGAGTAHRNAAPLKRKSVERLVSIDAVGFAFARIGGDERFWLMLLRIRGVGDQLARYDDK